ncbi:MAG: trehalose-phosphatase, partial [Candidatus Eiseniibacteriota bacterium]
MARSLFAPASWSRLLAALRSVEPILVGLDLDGTLAPIVRSPDLARIAPRTTRLLAGAVRAPGTRIAVVSARSVSAIRRLVPARGLIRIGQYGLDGLTAPTALVRSTLRDACARITRELRPVAEMIPGAWIEEKGLSVAIHDRAVSHQHIPSLRRALKPIAIRARLAGFRAVLGRRVTDFVPVGFDKGKALRALIVAFRPATTFYLGDSAGDEPAFRVLRRRDFAIRVGPGRTRARYRVGDLRGVTRVLTAIARLRAIDLTRM